MAAKEKLQCPEYPDCDQKEEKVFNRRQFLRTIGVAAIATSVVSPTEILISDKASAQAKKPTSETLVKMLYEGLSENQRKRLTFGWNDPKRSLVANNWRIVPEGIKDILNPDQRQLVKDIFKGVTNEESYERFLKQMKDDYGGFENYTCAIFGKPGEDKFEWVMTGRHLTIRCDGNSLEGAAFGGPIFYGHAVEFFEKPDHPGNVWWHEARLANKVFQALDGKQQKMSLLQESPEDSPETIRLKSRSDQFTGIALADLSQDQKGLVEDVMKELLAPYRQEDVEEAMAYLKANGGLDAIHLSFYKEDDIGDDGIWDRWMLQGPAFVWYFRGSPHVHAWIHIAAKA